MSEEERPSNLRLLEPPKEQPWIEMIEVLEQKLAQAKDGSLRGFVIAFEYANGQHGYTAFHRKGSESALLIAEMEEAKVVMIHGILARREQQGDS